MPSEAIYLEDMDTKKVWSVTVNPAPDNNDYYITYGFGYSNYKHTSNGVLQELKVFVPQKENSKVQILHLENELANIWRAFPLTALWWNGRRRRIRASTGSKRPAVSPKTTGRWPAIPPPPSSPPRPTPGSRSGTTGWE